MYSLIIIVVLMHSSAQISVTEFTDETACQTAGALIRQSFEEMASRYVGTKPFMIAGCFPKHAKASGIK